MFPKLHMPREYEGFKRNNTSQENDFVIYFLNFSTKNG